jgi:hypothetical protein
VSDCQEGCLLRAVKKVSPCSWAPAEGYNLSFDEAHSVAELSCRARHVPDMTEPLERVLSRLGSPYSTRLLSSS